MQIQPVGAICFGLVVGWIVYRTLRRKQEGAAISDIASVIAAVGGASVTALFGGQDLFAWYSVGLASGFFAYLLASFVLFGRKEAEAWMGD